MKKFYLLALVAAMFAACATDVTEDVAIEAPETLKVSFEESSRIQLDNGLTVWTAGDLVSVFYRSDANQQWKFQGNTGDRSGTIKRVSTPEYSHTTSKMVVAYPYNENYYLNPETCNLQAYLPAEQTYLKDSYGINGNIMVSQSEYKQFVLKSVCGWLKIQLTGNGEKVQTISLKGNNGEQVAGEVYINSADATASLAADMGSAGDNDNSAGGNLVFEDTILTEVTLNCGDGVTLSAEPTAFYIGLPPQEFSKGLTVEVACSDGSTMAKSTEKTITIERNTIQPMATLTYDGVVPEVYELAYTTNDGEPLDPLTTEGFGANFVENIFDPATGKGALKFDGKITIIPAKAFIACTNLTQIELTKDITAINAEAFSGCKALAVMDIPQSVKKIDDKAFYNCSGMLEITVPSSVTSIGTSSFVGCGGKATINCKISIGVSYYYGKFYNAKFTKVIIGDSVTSIGNYAFYGCTSLTSVTIGNSVTSIGQYAFDDCTSLKEVYYTGDLSVWCKINFNNDRSNPMCFGAKLYLNGVELTEVIIPDSVTEIGYLTFNGCTSLTSVTIPDSVTSIRGSAFQNCTSLTSVTIGDSVTSIGGSAFSGCTSLTSITIGDSVTSIGESAFYNCSSLTSVTIGNSVTEIGQYAFQNCTSLTSVTIPDSVTKIGSYAFYYCTSLTSVTIGDRVTEIGKCAFHSCTSLTSVTIGKRVTSIGYQAFYYCTSLASVTIPDSVTEIGYLAFNGCTSLTGITIGNSVTEIGSSAFDGCTSLTSVTIPDSVTEIGVSAFNYCTSLTSVTIGDSVTEIGYGAFSDCASLKEVYCKPTMPPSGGSRMFNWNASGRKIYVPRASVDAYKAASGWSDYKSYIEPYDFE